MKTLVIHPKDKSTDFLKPIYENIPNKTIITGGKTKDEVKELIVSHDRVIMLGHGCPSGLFSVGQFPFGMVINHEMVEVLNEKSENIYIWCNSDLFVNKYGLKGFFSGMFISEVGESKFCGVPSNQEVVDESNNLFSEVLGECVNEGVENIFDNVRIGYGRITDRNRVAKYNHQRLYVNQ